MAINRISETENPILDDGWWESVLAEDDSSNTRTGSDRYQKDVNKKLQYINWDQVLRVFREDEILALTVVGYNRGGLLVESDKVVGFVPSSHLVNIPARFEDGYREEIFSNYVGRSLMLKIIECVPDEERIVLSERAALSAAGRRPEIFRCLCVGQKISGEVTNITDFGVFVDLGGVEGLIHISELSWGRVIHPELILKVGRKVEVLVLEVVPERCRIALSLKRLSKNPWENAELRYPIDMIVSATVTSLVPFGAFAKLPDGLEGLIHMSEIPVPSNLSMKSFLSPGQVVDVRVLQVDSTRQRLGLSMKITQRA